MKIQMNDGPEMISLAREQVRKIWLDCAERCLPGSGWKRAENIRFPGERCFNTFLKEP
jgi:hypothetical protein